MENVLDYTLGGVFALIPAIMWIVKQVATDLVINSMKSLFSIKSDKRATLVYGRIMFLFLLAGFTIVFLSFSSTNDVSLELKEQENKIQKSDAEVALEASIVLLDEVKKSVDNKRKRDAEIIKKREKRFVYQIGEIKDNEKSLVRLYEKLKKNSLIDISKVYVFEPKRKKYFLYLNNIGFEDDLKDSLSVIRNKLLEIEPIIKVVDLTSFCKAKKYIQETKPLKHRKYRIPKYKCSK